MRLTFQLPSLHKILSILLRRRILFLRNRKILPVDIKCLWLLNMWFSFDQEMRKIQYDSITQLKLWLLFLLFFNLCHYLIFSISLVSIYTFILISFALNKLAQSFGEGNGNPLQYSYLENPVDRGAWWATVHRVTESDTTEVTWHACRHWRRKWQPTPVFLPGESQGQRSLVGCRLWGCIESDTTEAT